MGRRFGGLVAVEDVTFSIMPGERRAVLGPNGAGKTTLFNLIAGEYRPTHGKIRFFGHDVTRLPPRKRVRIGLTRTYQNALLFQGLSVNDNLYLAFRGVVPNRMSLLRPRRGDRYVQRAGEICEQIGLSSVRYRPVGELSHGEQRQLELGIALAGGPRILILDEPAAGLAPGERVTLTNLLLALDPTISVLLIEHDMDVAFRIAQRVTVMHNGHIIADGTPDDIRNSEEIQRVYLGEHNA
ncbi:MAG: ABC transporter ATP-binding protein [Chloroflexota bacterium]